MWQDILKTTLDSPNIGCMKDFRIANCHKFFPPTCSATTMGRESTLVHNCFPGLPMHDGKGWSADDLISTLHLHEICPEVSSLGQQIERNVLSYLLWFANKSDVCQCRLCIPTSLHCTLGRYRVYGVGLMDKPSVRSDCADCFKWPSKCVSWNL